MAVIRGTCLWATLFFFAGAWDEKYHRRQYAAAAKNENKVKGCVAQCVLDYACRDKSFALRSANTTPLPAAMEDHAAGNPLCPQAGSRTTGCLPLLKKMIICCTKRTMCELDARGGVL